jgi:DNA polymerase I
VDKKSRIHCSLNLNTETGRLSSRRPNLQNQPALEKDQYKIRDAFVAEEGNTFIVADYGQLELRVLAHITNCKSMIEAFSSGGCFHSRTAMGMYDYIREAVDSGKVFLEWDYSKGQPTVPLVKDMFASERRKAKTLNFSIAYGKTVHGLAQDWGITKEEAQNTLDAWYRDRPEVRKWQEQTQLLAKKSGFVRTIMGRYRRLPDATRYGSPAAHALRAAINTPIQGSAADIVMMAMLMLWKSEVLKNLGWRLLLQVHDEVILEGPKESRDEVRDGFMVIAKLILITCCRPWLKSDVVWKTHSMVLDYTNCKVRCKYVCNLFCYRIFD